MSASAEPSCRLGPPCRATILRAPSPRRAVVVPGDITSAAQSDLRSWSERSIVSARIDLPSQQSWRSASTQLSNRSRHGNLQANVRHQCFRAGPHAARRAAHAGEEIRHHRQHRIRGRQSISSAFGPSCIAPPSTGASLCRRFPACANFGHRDSHVMKVCPGIVEMQIPRSCSRGNGF